MIHGWIKYGNVRERYLILPCLWRTMTDRNNTKNGQIMLVLKNIYAVISNKDNSEKRSFRNSYLIKVDKRLKERISYS